MSKQMPITVNNQFATEVLNIANNHFYRSIYLATDGHWLRDQITEKGNNYIEVKPADIPHALAIYKLTGNLYETLHAVNPTRLKELCDLYGLSDQ